MYLLIMFFCALLQRLSPRAASPQYTLPFKEPPTVSVQANDDNDNADDDWEQHKSRYHFDLITCLKAVTLI